MLLKAQRCSHGNVTGDGIPGITLVFTNINPDDPSTQYVAELFVDNNGNYVGMAQVVNWALTDRAAYYAGVSNKTLSHTTLVVWIWRLSAQPNIIDSNYDHATVLQLAPPHPL